MFPHTDACIIGKEIIEASKAVFDAVITRAKRCYQICKGRGNQIFQRAAEAVWQAAVAEEIWNGFSFDFDDIAPF
jgi:shikimate 5-dehydrogenase